MVNAKTSIFFSSTCYDLAQIRKNLRDFADSIEFDPILSESNSFAIDPDLIAVDNCFDNIKNRADIYVLIIGNRFGSTSECGKSITNLEYIEAKAKGIPKYCFIMKETDLQYRLWTRNKDAVKDCGIDNPRLFEFIDEIFQSGSDWVFKFEYADDIISTLKIQLSYLFSDSLKKRMKLNVIDRKFLQLDPNSLLILSERKPGWEFYLFGEQLRQLALRTKSKRLDLDLKISFESPIHLDSDNDVKAWIFEKNQKIIHLIDGLNRMIKNGAELAIGKRGEDGDPERIIYLASRIVDIYELLLDWKIEFYKTYAEDKFQRLMDLASELISNNLSEIEAYIFTAYDKVVDGLNPERDEKFVNLALHLSVTDCFKEFISEFTRMFPDIYFPQSDED